MANPDVVVVIGAGGMGQTIARQQGAGRTVLLADINEAILKEAADSMRSDGYAVTEQRVDVSSRESVGALADAATGLGAVTQIVHTAGLSPAQAPAKAILAVDLLGVALVLEEFAAVVASGGAGVVISSMAGHLGVRLDSEVEARLADTPADQLLQLPLLVGVTEAAAAYGLAKRGNHLQVQAASRKWGQRGARINSVSPGVIATPMGQQELGGEHGARIRAMIEHSGTGRIGTATDIADAVAFLLGPTATFITGTDLLVDGGVVPLARSMQALNA
ncbi:SDR family oxidoreductase [Dactylosporangium sp. NPDC005572]|uniref:SDR family oxidoreductase n=1 Tax=Dactylosporangium sp. NPDC005572 TaxID=3156889 RepID=UPI0033B4ED92